MARTEFGGTFASWLVQSTTEIADGVHVVTLPTADVPLDIRDAPSGTVISDFLNESGTPVSSIIVPQNDPYIPRFSGPEGTATLWVQASTGRWLKIPHFTEATSSDAGPNPPERLTIYYGIPQGVNGVWSNESAAQHFANFDIIVFGEGLQDVGHTYHTSTVAIIARIKQLNPRAVIYGYCDVGVNNGGTNQSQAAMAAKSDEWKLIGAGGMLLDQFGYDYGVSRSRQNTIVDYCHTQDLRTIINVWNMDDAFSSDVDATYNPAGTATVADERDYQLLESWIVSTEFYAAPGYAPTVDLKSRGDAARQYRTNLGVKFLASSMVNYGVTLPEEHTAWFNSTEGFALIFGADGWGVDAHEYASIVPNQNVSKLWPFQNGTYNREIAYWVSDAWDIFRRDDLHLSMEYNSGNGTWLRSPEVVNGDNVKLAGGNEVEFVDSQPGGKPWFRLRVPNDGTATSTWPNRLEIQYWDQSTSQYRTGWHVNEKGLHRVRGVTPSDTPSRVMAHPSQNPGVAIDEVTKDNNTQKIWQVFLDEILAHVGVRMPYAINPLGERLYFGTADPSEDAAYADHRPVLGSGFLHYNNPGG